MVFWPIQDKDFTVFWFCRTLATFSVFGEGAKILPQVTITLLGKIFQPSEMVSYIRAQREQNAFKIVSLPNRKILLCVYSFCAKWDKSCPNISTIWKKFKILFSNLESMQWAKKPSHATVPLKPFVYMGFWCNFSYIRAVFLNLTAHRFR